MDGLEGEEDGLEDADEEELADESTLAEFESLEMFSAPTTGAGEALARAEPPSETALITDTCALNESETAKIAGTKRAPAAHKV